MRINELYAAGVAPEDACFAVDANGATRRVGLAALQSAMAVQVGTKTITENGDYDPADDGLDAYSGVTVEVSGGGGSGVPLVSAADWDALTTAQKQAYGLVAIQDTNSGYRRGILAYGGDYAAPGLYLPNSDATKVICEAYVGNFIPSAGSWGLGDSPITFYNLLAAAYDQTEDAIVIPTLTDGTIAYVDLLSDNTPYTAYLVGRVKTANSSDTRILSSMQTDSNGYGMIAYGRDAVKIGSWNDDTSTGISASVYFALALQFGGSRSGFGVARDASAVSSVITKSPAYSGRYVTIGRTSPVSGVGFPEPTDMCVRYMAVVKSAESQQDVLANLSNLASVFL